jgi:pimeloyl-ACP methyl ester carboxylesterase
MVGRERELSLAEVVARLRFGGAALILLAVLPLDGCGASLPPRVEFCGVRVPGKAIYFRSEDGVRLAGAALGRGNRGVVFANGWGATSQSGRARPVSYQSAAPRGGLYCEWLQARRFTDALIRSGFQLLLFDYRGTGESDTPRGAAHERYDLDLAAAVDELRRRGVDDVVLVGSSFGGIVVIATAPDLDPEPRAIATLSASGFAGTNSGRGYGNLDAKAAVERLDVPLLLVVAEGDPYVGDSRALGAAATTKEKELVILPGSSHATALLSDEPAAAEVRARLVNFIKKHGGR